MKASKDNFIKFLRDFIYPHECCYQKGHYGDLKYVTFEDVDGDSGGVTKFGIDYSSHKLLGVDGIKNLTVEKADDIYWNEFKKNKSSKLDIPLCYAISNCEINCGIGRANKILTKGIKTADGFLDEQEAFYERLCESSPKLNKFKKGWLQRTKDLREWISKNQS
jgi:lysozyme family protein